MWVPYMKVELMPPFSTISNSPTYRSLLRPTAFRAMSSGNLLQVSFKRISVFLSSVSGSSHSRSFPEDPEGGGEEEEKGGEEERHPKRPSHLPLPRWTIAPLLSASDDERGERAWMKSTRLVDCDDGGETSAAVHRRKVLWCKQQRKPQWDTKLVEEEVSQVLMKA